MIRAFWFVTWRSFKNRMLLRVRKLRSPRYAISLAAGLAYLWFFSFHRFGPPSSHVQAGLSKSNFGVDVLSLVAAVAMLVAWALPDSSGGLTFTAAEIQFLFPAPLQRRDLILYKIFRQQPRMLISSSVAWWFGFRQAAFVGVWATFVVLSIYFLTLSLARAQLKRFHVGFAARLSAAIVAGAGAIALVVRDLRESTARIPDFEAAVRATEPLFHTAAVKTMLFIPRLFASAAFPRDLRGLIVSLAGIALTGAVLFRIAVRLDISFEDASLEASQRRAETVAARRGRGLGRRVMFRRIPPPFRLTGHGLPEVAIVWKNLTACFRTSVAWIFFLAMIFAAFLVDAAIFRSEGARVSAAGIGLAFSAFFPFLGSQLLRQDLRMDLPRIDVLKSLPIQGERLVAAQIAAPAIMVSFIELVFLVASAVATRLAGVSGRLAFAGSAEFIVIALLFAVPVCTTQLLIHNATAILLPGWAIQSDEESRGFAVLGQRLVVLGANVIVLCIGLIPAAIVFVPLFFLARHYGSNPFVLAASTAPAIAVLLVEIWIAIRFLGSQFEQIDITNEIDAAL